MRRAKEERELNPGAEGRHWLSGFLLEQIGSVGSDAAEQRNPLPKRTILRNKISSTYYGDARSNADVMAEDGRIRLEASMNDGMAPDLFPWVSVTEKSKKKNTLYRRTI